MLFSVLVKGHTAVQIWAIVIKTQTDFIIFVLLFYFVVVVVSSSFPSPSPPTVYSNPNHKTGKQITNCTRKAKKDQ